MVQLLVTALAWLFGLSAGLLGLAIAAAAGSGGRWLLALGGVALFAVGVTTIVAWWKRRHRAAPPDSALTATAAINPRALQGALGAGLVAAALYFGISPDVVVACELDKHDLEVLCRVLQTRGAVGATTCFDVVLACGSTAEPRARFCAGTKPGTSAIVQRPLGAFSNLDACRSAAGFSVDAVDVSWQL